jgi:four helix bundle protein
MNTKYHDTFANETLAVKYYRVERFTSYKSSKDFVTLSAWRKAREVRMFFYNEIIPMLPPEEKFNLGVQIRRASVSVTANISEGYGRFHFKEGIQHYRIARGSRYELKDHLIACLDLEYINDALVEKGVDLIENAKITLNGFIKFIEAKQY